MTPAPLLLFAVGNPSRGDDALGPTLLDRVSASLAPEIARGEVELLADFQLQPEHALDLVGRARVVFVDACVRAAPPFEWRRLRLREEARRDTSTSSHAMSPSALLEAYRAVEPAGSTPPEAWTLAIRGERFELGEPLSPRAAAHLDAAVDDLVSRVRGEWAEGADVTGGGVVAGERVVLEGVVQGVGFRPWVHRVASALGLSGKVWNTSNGVTVDAYGPPAALRALGVALQREAPAGAVVRSVHRSPLASLPPGAHGFTVGESDASGPVAMGLPPDLATCAACLAEVASPSDRHHGYAFTSCTGCGPRLAVILALPYDRQNTTLAGFALCTACARDYATPSARRFHAQTLACPACGPRVWLADPEGVPTPAGEPVAAAAAALRDGAIVGVQGLGAFHLVCDATSSRAVAELRRRKRRETQPLAVMVADLEAALALAELDVAAREALCSPARPIVLAPSRGASIACEVRGPSLRAGVLLPYTPLHAALLAEAGRPLVFTSGNASGGPAIIDHEGALTHLSGLVDALLLHDRPIARRVEDSVVATGPRGLRVLRRSRGFAPHPVRLPRASPEPVLAVGGHQKNTACVVVGDLAYLTPHLGDLGLYEGELAWRREVEGFEALLGVRAEVLAHDLHPDYASTRYALARAARRRVGVQHHAAHALATLAEIHVREPVLAVVYDGTGWGPDGTAWGAELLAVDGARWQRVSAFRPVPLPGGERAIRDVWRAALGMLHDAFGSDEARALAERFEVFRAQTPARLDTVLRALDGGAATTRARGLGRWFDALGALVLGLSHAGFDGHVALALEEHADPRDAPPYPIDTPTRLALDGPLSAANEIDPRPTVHAVVQDLLAGAAPGWVAARVHATVVEATCTVAARALAETGLRRVVLSGGALQNRLLERGLVARLGAETVVMARDVPVNDGGLALGQAWAAVLALTEPASAAVDRAAGLAREDEPAITCSST
ncbi:MAG: carbamoyltransferase HypF [Myxococcales bacterium]|nr:carbamoyltransferase HypF [Myxococcales bacterium]